MAAPFTALSAVWGEEDLPCTCLYLLDSSLGAEPLTEVGLPHDFFCQQTLVWPCCPLVSIHPCSFYSFVFICLFIMNLVKSWKHETFKTWHRCARSSASSQERFGGASPHGENETIGMIHRQSLGYNNEQPRLLSSKHFTSETDPKWIIQYQLISY